MHNLNKSEKISNFSLFNRSKNTKLSLLEWDKRFYSWDKLGITDPKKWKNKKEIKTSLDAIAKTRAIELNLNLDGFRIKTRSYVGSIQIGNLIIQIKPKILDINFMSLLSYALNLNHLKILHFSLFNQSQDGFIELLLIQLRNEVENILNHGLYRNYHDQCNELMSPRGKIDFQRYIRYNAVPRNKIPCRYYNRLENNLLNQILLAGMKLGAFLTLNLQIRYSLLELVKIFSETIEQIDLISEKLKQGFNLLNRLTEHYRLALNLIQILHNPPGLEDNELISKSKFPGFFFDMNYFFQHLLLRFFEETLGKNKIQSEFSIKNMFSYLTYPKFGKKKNPELRPDYIISNKSNHKIILDAKYRDLSKKKLPSKWLYQLGMYALSGLGLKSQANHTIILYPTDDFNVSDVKIQIDLQGNRKFSNVPQVILRPVVWQVLSKYILNSNIPKYRNESKIFAKSLVFSDEISDFYREFRKKTII